MNDNTSLPEIPDEVLQAVSAKLGAPVTLASAPPSVEEAPPMAAQFDKRSQPAPIMERSRLPDDPQTREVVQKAEARREDAYHARYMWQGREVKWTLRREGLWRHLRMKLQFPPQVDIMQATEYFAALPDAIIVLFLGLHEPHEWEGLRDVPETAFAAMEDWAETGVWRHPHRQHIMMRELETSTGPIIPMESMKAACHLWRRIVDDVIDSIPSPVDEGKGSGSGN